MARAFRVCLEYARFLYGCSVVHGATALPRPDPEPASLPREGWALAYITTLKQLGVWATVSSTHARSTTT